jgi:uncharacterized RmlC-like cupin family protein
MRDPEGAGAAPNCRVVRGGDPYQGRQGIAYFAGLTGATAGSRAISMVAATVPPGGRTKAHLHRGIETAAYVLEGGIEMWFGAELGEMLPANAGDYAYVPGDMPHVLVNRSDRPCRAIVAHTAADDQAGIVMLPELDPKVP